MSKLERIVHDDSNGLDYILVGEIYLPLIVVPEEKRDIGFYGSIHRNYLKDYKSGLYSYLTLTGKLWTYLADLNEQCIEYRDFLMNQMMEQEDNSTDTAPSYLMEQILDKAGSGEVQLARAANKASRKIQLLHYSLQTAAGVMVALLLLFSIPNLDFTSLHQDTSSQTDRILPEHENGRLYQFTRELGQNIGDGTGSFIKYISDFSSKLMNGGK